MTAEYSIDTVAWYENAGGSPPGWAKHVVVAAGDVDGDADADMSSANFNDEGIAWYEHVGAAPATWTKRVLTGFWVGAWAVAAADLDGDGDLDGIGGLTNTSCGPPLDCRGVEWYESNGASPPSFIGRPVSPGLVGASSVHPADVDGDGDTDILSVDTANDRVLWFENDGDHPPSWTQRIVTATVDDPWTVFSADLDADGDVDVVAGSWWDSKVVWYESNGGSPPSFTAHDIGICGGPEALYTARVDADPDLDVLCAANVAGKVFFFENVPTPVGVETAAPASPALHGVSPNPGYGVMRVLFSLADDRPARIEVMAGADRGDGRRGAALDVEPGRRAGTGRA